MSIQLAQANSIHIPLADKSVHAVITSPPFYGLRDYSLPSMIWGGGPDCEHVWDVEHVHSQIRTGLGLRDSPYSVRGGAKKAQEIPLLEVERASCQHCGAWRGCLGNEPTLELYVDHLVDVFRDVRRVLRDDGVVWLNLGDCYFGDSPVRKKSAEAFSKKWDPSQTRSRGGSRRSAASVDGLKPKDLCGIPWRVALALQQDGWWLRSAPPWVKRNCMPESARDRPTAGHEYWLMLAKSKRYYYDADAVREPHSMKPQRRLVQRNSERDKAMRPDKVYAYRLRDEPGVEGNPAGRNRRTTDTFFESLDAVIAIQRRYLEHLEYIRANGGMLLDRDGDPLALIFATKGYAGAHYATFNPDMIEPLVKCSTSERGVCPDCGRPWERVTTRTFEPQPDVSLERGIKGAAGQKPMDKSSGWDGVPRGTTQITTLGWRPPCACYDDLYHQVYPQARSARKRHQRAVTGDWWERARARAGDPEWSRVPAIVLDLFVGSGTTCEVARRLGRHSVGLDLSLKYLQGQASTRLVLDKLAEWESGRRPVEGAWQELPLFAAMEEEGN